MTTMTHGEIFLMGMITAVLLCGMIAVGFAARPRRSPRRRADEDASRMRALDEAFAEGLRRGREEGPRPLMPRPTQVLKVVSRADGRWVGTTARGGKEPA